MFPIAQLHLGRESMVAVRMVYCSLRSWHRSFERAYGKRAKKRKQTPATQARFTEGQNRCVFLSADGERLRLSFI